MTSQHPFQEVMQKQFDRQTKNTHHLSFRNRLKKKKKTCDWIPPVAMAWKTLPTAQSLQFLQNLLLLSTMRILFFRRTIPLASFLGILMR